jgi:hypothetical protein
VSDHDLMIWKLTISWPDFRKVCSRLEFNIICSQSFRIRSSNLAKRETYEARNMATLTHVHYKNRVVNLPWHQFSWTGGYERCAAELEGMTAFSTSDVRIAMPTTRLPTGSMSWGLPPWTCSRSRQPRSRFLCHLAQTKIAPQVYCFLMFCWALFIKHGCEYSRESLSNTRNSQNPERS